jgi:cell division protease FtsH
MNSPLPPRAPSRATDGPAGRPSPAPDQAPEPPRRQPRLWWLGVALFMIANYVVTQLFFQEEPAVAVSYTFFKQQVTAGNVASLVSRGEAIEGEFRQPVRYPPASAESGASTGDQAAAPPQTLSRFATRRPAFAEPGLEALLEAQGVVVEAASERRSSLFEVLVSFGPTLLLIAAFVWISRRAASAGGGLFSLGRSRAKRYSEAAPAVTFDDVAGIDEAENELIEIVDFLKNPAQVRAARRHRAERACCWSAPPGTGKTLLARAVAGQAGVPFFSLSASEFVEMIVGVGASRVRDLFKQAREAAPRSSSSTNSTRSAARAAAAHSSAGTTSASRR